MKILVLQHARIEHPGSFQQFSKMDNHKLMTIHLDEGEKLPTLDGFDALWVLGGPMDVWEEKKYSWLAQEKAIIRDAVKTRKMPFLGICLGHQLLAEALGGKCEKAEQPEVGIYQVQLTSAGIKDPIFKGISEQFFCLQWHGAEVTKLPYGAAHLASSKYCSIQSIRWGKNAYSLQFHVEVEKDTVQNWALIPEYSDALTISLGKDGAKILQKDCQKHMSEFNNIAQTIYKNWFVGVSAN